MISTAAVEWAKGHPESPRPTYVLQQLLDVLFRFHVTRRPPARHLQDSRWALQIKDQLEAELLNSPLKARPYVLLGVWHLCRHEYSRAEPLLLAAVERDPFSFEAHSWLAILLAKRRLRDRAKKYQDLSANLPVDKRLRKEIDQILRRVRPL